MIHKFFLSCDRSLLLADEFVIVSMPYGIIKYPSYNILKQIFFLKEGNSISYVRMFLSQN